MLSRICLECDRANAPDAKFCSECGSPLQVKLCKHCHKANDYAAHFCQGCGRTLPVAAAASADPAPEPAAAAAEAAAAPPLFTAEAAPSIPTAIPRPDEATIVRAFSGPRVNADGPSFAPPPATVIEPAEAAPLVLDPPPGYRPPMVIHRSAELRPRRATPAWLLGASVVVLIASVLVLTAGRGGAPSPAPAGSPVTPSSGAPDRSAPGVAATTGSVPAAAAIGVEDEKSAPGEPATRPASETGAAAARAPARRNPAAGDPAPAAPATGAPPARETAARECTQDLAVLGLCRPDAPGTSAAPNPSDPPASSQDRP